MAHKHAALIIDWAQNGTPYEWRDMGGTWRSCTTPTWNEHMEWRRADLTAWQKELWDAAHSTDKKVEFEYEDNVWVQADAMTDPDSFEYHKLQNRNWWRVVDVEAAWKTKLRNAVRAGHRVEYKPSDDRPWEESTVTRRPDAEDPFGKNVVESQYRIVYVEDQWKTDLRNAVLNGDRVEIRVHKDIWAESTINIIPDDISFPFLSQYQYRVVEAAWKTELRQSVRDGDRVFMFDRGDWSYSSINMNPDKFDFLDTKESDYRITVMPKTYKRYIWADGHSVSQATLDQTPFDNIEITLDKATNKVIDVRLIK